MYQCYLILAEKIQPLSCLTISSRLSYQSGILPQEGRQWSWFPKLNSIILFCFVFLCIVLAVLEHTMLTRLASILDLPASASQMLGIKACATTT